MIIQVRGTSGSGKTWAMKQLMAIAHWHYGSHLPCLWVPNHVEKRKKPLFYVSNPETSCPQTIIMGHYASPCGGCDTIGSAREIYELTKKLHQDYPNHHIIQEGLLLSEDVKWTSQMGDVRSLFLTTPLEKCLEQIGSRRAAVGNEKPLNPDNTTNRIKTIERARQKLVELGICCTRCSAGQVPNLILKLLRE